MDLSKLPKLSESPAPPAPVPDAKLTMPSAGRATPQMAFADVGVDVLVSLIIGAIFLMMGLQFGGWLMAEARGEIYITTPSYIWSEGTPKAGQPVELFELQGGTGWLVMGQWVLGACLILDALLILIAMMSPRLRRPLIVLAMVLCAGGAIANVVAVVMQIKMGFTQPIISMLGILVGGVIAFFHARHLFADRPQAQG